MLHLNSNSYIPRTKGPDLVSNVLSPIYLQFNLTCDIFIRRSDFMLATMLFLTKSCNINNRKVTALSPSVHRTRPMIYRTEIFTGSNYKKFHSWEMFPKPLMCKVKTICIIHEKRNSKKFIVRMLSGVTL